MAQTVGGGRNKLWSSARLAVADISDGAVVLVGGFGDVGVPFRLLDALAAHTARGLTVVSNNCGTGERGLAALFKAGLVSKACASFPSQSGNHHFKAAFDRGEVELELIPQGTLAERIRCAGAGLGGFYTRTGFGTELADGHQTREINGVRYILELPLRGDVALISADVADEAGNLRFRRSARNFNPVMAMAAGLTIVQVNRIIPVGALDPDDVHLPGVFVDRLVELTSP
jgi:3-oxoadipate CoA-transferase alpha subunit